MDPVDAFIDQNVLPGHQEIVAVLRRIVQDAAPSAALAMSYGLPMWKGRGFLAYLSPSKRGITFGFPYGASFSDPDGRLRGRGKPARHLKYARASEIDEVLVRFFVAQAVAGDTRQVA